MSPQFIKSRKEGEKAQKYVKGMFESWGLQFAATPRGYRPEYDGIIIGTLFGNPVRSKIEIKYDRLAATTNNIFLDINSLSKSTASILCICLNDPIDTVLVLPLEDALNYARSHANITGGEWNERSCLVDKNEFITKLKPKILTTNK